MTISANAIITARQAQVPAEDWPEASDAVALLAAGCCDQAEADEKVGIILSTCDPILLLPVVAGCRAFAGCALLRLGRRVRAATRPVAGRRGDGMARRCSVG